MCVLLCFVSLLSLVSTQRHCPPGRFCQIGADCASNINFCVTRCPNDSDHNQQGNHLTGNCERREYALCTYNYDYDNKINNNYWCEQI